MTIRIVADSACDIPAVIAQELRITIVPVYINIGDTSYLDGVELTRADFYASLPDYPVFPTTAAPASGAFASAYKQLVAEGATTIISIHIAGGLSNTYNAARLGAEEVEGPATVHLFDTQQVTMGSGLLVIEAAEAAAAGRSAEEILLLLESLRPRVYIYAALDTLEFLRRSGRVNWAQFGLGTLLQIKPILTVHNAQVEVQERVRTLRKALQRLLMLLEDKAPLYRLAILHADNLPRVQQLQRDVEHLLPRGREPIIMEITPAIGAHSGPGAVGFALIGRP
jgi:DegV family protein with EDD domain